MSAVSVVLSGGAAAFAAPESKDPSLASVPPSHDLSAGTEASFTPGWERIGNFIVLLAYSCVVLFTVRYHEKWADEAQAWLIARDLPLSRIWFYELRYEGSPGLWHTILWIAQHWFHAPYSALGYIGVAFAIAGVAVLIFEAPFPWYVRWPLAFTYFFIYQYAVIARPYTLLPLLCFVVAILFKDVKHPGRMTAALIVLANLSLHGTVLAAAFGLLYLLAAIKSWGGFDVRLRNRYYLCAAALVVTFVFIGIILRPTPDNEEFVVKHDLERLPQAEKDRLHLPTPVTKLTAITSGGFLDSLTASVAFLLLTAAWFFSRRRLLVFVLPVGLMIALYSVVHGYAHHQGTPFVAAIAALWIAWPSWEEARVFTAIDQWALRGMVGLLWCLCVVNLWDAAVVIKREYLFPYSGSADVVKYLKSVGADRSVMFGYVYGVTAVQAYFDHNVFPNLPTSYFHHGLPLSGTRMDPDELLRVGPEYVVVFTTDPQLFLSASVQEFSSRGYQVVHFSDGYYLYKQGVYQREAFFIFRRIPTPDAGLR